MISIIIPAYNEEKYLPATLEAVLTALGRIESPEIIVVDNGSTDTTREMACRLGARVVDEQVHNIARVRNAGAASALGDVLIFIDADTTVSPGLFEKIIDAMSYDRCFGGSVAVEYERTYRRNSIRFYLFLWQSAGRLLKWRQGAAQFCRADAFRELGGYDESIYLGEDVEFHWRLAELARRERGGVEFIEDPPVRTSSRRYERMGFFRLLFFTHPITILLGWRTRWFWKDWYENAIR